MTFSSKEKRTAGAVVIEYLKTKPDGALQIEIRRDCGLAASTVHNLMPVLTETYIDRWVPSKAHGGYSSVHCIGSFEDAPHPTGKTNSGPPVHKGRSITRPNLLAYVIAFELLMTAAVFTKEEMIELTGWHDTTATRFIKRLHARKLIHITAWLPDKMNRDAIPVYARGNRRDKARKRLTPAERSSRHRASVRNRRQQENMKGLFNGLNTRSPRQESNS